MLKSDLLPVLSLAAQRYNLLAVHVMALQTRNRKHSFAQMQRNLIDGKSRVTCSSGMPFAVVFGSRRTLLPSSARTPGVTAEWCLNARIQIHTSAGWA